MSNSKQKTVKVPLGTIKEDLFVRTALNDDRVLFFAELYEANADVDPIKITEQSYTLVDGRHRKHALLFLERERADKKRVFYFV